MRRDDVVHHSDGYRDGHPAINIKLYGLWEDVKREAPKIAEQEGDGDTERFLAWLENIRDDSDTVETAMMFALEGNWEMVERDAKEIFDSWNVEVYQEGRSGGWLVVHGLPDVEEWDAVLLAKWAKFNRYVAEAVKGFPWSVTWQLYVNAYVSDRDKEDDRIAVESTRGDLDALTGDPQAEQESNYRMIV